jgi:hypothetical protein
MIYKKINGIEVGWKSFRNEAPQDRKGKDGIKNSSDVLKA